MNIEDYSNWNGKISKKEFQALENLSDHSEKLSFLSKITLKELKKNMILQMNNYTSRKDISPISKDYVKRMTNKIIDNINKHLHQEIHLENLENEFPSIKNIEWLKLLINQKIIKYSDVERLFKKWWKKVKINYINWKTEIIKIIELKKLFDELKQAQIYSIKSAQEWIKSSKDWKHINYDAISSYANKTIKKEENLEKERWKIKLLLAKAQIYIWAQEDWNDKISIKLQKEMKKFWLDIKNNPSNKWCAAFVWNCLVKAWYFKDIRELKHKLPKPYPDVASNYLWIWYFKWHIWIYTWGNTMINWNSHNMVRYSKVNWNKLVWWIMPYDIWNTNKIHFYHKKKLDSPVWAILVFKRWKKRLPYNIRKKSWIQ